MKCRGCLMLICIFILLLVSVLNIEVSYRQGIDGVVSTIKTPLYIKVIDFISRDYHYRRLTKDITEGHNTDQAKVIAIFNWTFKHIKPQPKELRVVDDHILHIVIRGYGTSDQIEDVFTTLCGYAGLEAYRTYISPRGSRKRMPISFVKIDGKWRLFNAFVGNYFLNEEGKLASIEDITRNPELIDQAKTKPVIKGLAYKEYFNSLSELNIINYTRTRKQMPLPRLMFKIRKIIKR